MSHYGLAIHTASPELGLAISNFAGDDRCQIWNLGRGVSNLLHQYLLEFLLPQTWNDLAWIAVAQGPGGFTGTRIGVVTARTLAQQLELPLFSISTLAAAAWNTATSPELGLETGAIAVQMQAQRGELFTAIYHYENKSTPLIPLQPDAVMSLEQWQSTLATWTTPYHLLEIHDSLGNTTTNLLDLAHLDWHQGKRPHWSDALPFYGYRVHTSPPRMDLRV